MPKSFDESVRKTGEGRLRAAYSNVDMEFSLPILLLTHPLFGSKGRLPWCLTSVAWYEFLECIYDFC